MEENEQQTTNVEKLEASLDSLLKAADATEIVGSMRKASASGSISEEGGVGDDFADNGDAGPVSAEELLYGKMTAAGMGHEAAMDIIGFMRGKMGSGSAPTQAAPSTSGFPMVQHDRVSPKGKRRMHGKADEEMEEEPEEEEETEQEQPQGKAGGGFRAARGGGRSPVPPPAMQKSFAEQFADDDDITKAVDVSPFIEAITARTADALDSIAKSARIRGSKQDKMNKAMAIAFYEMGAMVKSLARVNNELGRRLGIVESTPQAPKGFTGEPAAKRALSKAMPGEQGRENSKLNKRQIVSTLSYMNIEKGIREIGGTRTNDLIVKAEAGDIVGKSVLDAVHTFLKVHPMERDAAMSYA